MLLKIYQQFANQATQLVLNFEFWLKQSQIMELAQI